MFPDDDFVIEPLPSHMTNLQHFNHHHGGEHSHHHGNGQSHLHSNKDSHHPSNKESQHENIQKDFHGNSNSVKDDIVDLDSVSNGHLSNNEDTHNSVHSINDLDNKNHHRNMRNHYRDTNHGQNDLDLNNSHGNTGHHNHDDKEDIGLLTNSDKEVDNSKVMRHQSRHFHGNRHKNLQNNNNYGNTFADSDSNGDHIVSVHDQELSVHDLGTKSSIAKSLDSSSAFNTHSVSELEIGDVNSVDDSNINHNQNDNLFKDHYSKISEYQDSGYNIENKNNNQNNSLLDNIEDEALFQSAKEGVLSDSVGDIAQDLTKEPKDQHYDVKDRKDVKNVDIDDVEDVKDIDDVEESNLRNTQGQSRVQSSKEDHSRGRHIMYRRSSLRLHNKDNYQTTGETCC